MCAKHAISGSVSGLRGEWQMWHAGPREAHGQGGCVFGQEIGRNHPNATKRKPNALLLTCGLSLPRCLFFVFFFCIFCFLHFLFFCLFFSLVKAVQQHCQWAEMG